MSRPQWAENALCFSKDSDYYVCFKKKKTRLQSFELGNESQMMNSNEAFICACWTKLVGVMTCRLEFVDFIMPAVLSGLPLCGCYAGIRVILSFSCGNQGSFFDPRTQQWWLQVGPAPPVYCQAKWLNRAHQNPISSHVYGSGHDQQSVYCCDGDKREN